MVWLDGDEDRFAGGEGVAGSVGDLRFAEVAAAVVFDVARGESERDGQGHGAQILHLHLPGHGKNVAGAVRFAHGFVEEGGDDASMGVAGRAGETAGEAKVRDDVTVGIDEEFEAEAGRILEATAEALVEGSVGEGTEGQLGW